MQCNEATTLQIVGQCSKMVKAPFQKYEPEQVEYIKTLRQVRMSWIETRDKFNARFNSNRTVDSLRSRLYLDRRGSNKREHSDVDDNTSRLPHGIYYDTGLSPVPHDSCRQSHKVQRGGSQAIDDSGSDKSVHESHITDIYHDAESHDDLGNESDTDSDDDSGSDDDMEVDDDLDVGNVRANEIRANGADGTSLQEHLELQAQHFQVEGATLTYVVWEDS
jgi:hypothetical protein